jgi:hypothetical protein
MLWVGVGVIFLENLPSLLLRECFDLSKKHYTNVIYEILFVVRGASYNRDLSCIERRIRTRIGKGIGIGKAL